MANDTVNTFDCIKDNSTLSAFEMILDRINYLKENQEIYEDMVLQRKQIIQINFIMNS